MKNLTIQTRVLLLALVPVLGFFAFAYMIRRGQEFRRAAASMTDIALRLSEPELHAAEGMVSVGQTIRREVAAMGDGIERAIARKPKGHDFVIDRRGQAPALTRHMSVTGG